MPTALQSKIVTFTEEVFSTRRFRRGDPFLKKRGDGRDHASKG